MDYELKLRELGYTLPPAPAKAGAYSPCKEFGENLAYISGCGPLINGVNYLGKLGRDISFEDGQKAAVNCALNMLAVVKENLGSLNRISKVVKLIVFVASTDDFYQQPQVANAASELLGNVFGELPSRSAIGVNVLPGNIAVEIEMLIETKPLEQTTI